jgi:hypothetical protein
MGLYMFDWLSYGKRYGLAIFSCTVGLFRLKFNRCRLSVLNGGRVNE